MKINLVCFSQTGNTLKVAQSLESAFIQEGHEVELIPFKDADPTTAVECDLLGIGTPCFSSQAPSPVRNFLLSLNPIENKQVFVFATSGGGPGKVLYDLTKILRGKKAEVVGGFLIRGEVFYPAPCLVGRFPKRPNAKDLERTKQFAKDLSDHVNKGIPGPLPSSRTDALTRKFGFYDMVGCVTKDSIIRFLMPKPKLQKDLCDKCEWCVDECPTNNIKMEESAVLGDACIRCYRCLTGCPKQALSVNWFIANPLVWSIYNQSFEKWFGDIEKGEKIY